MPSYSIFEDMECFAESYIAVIDTKIEKLLDLKDEFLIEINDAVKGEMSETVERYWRNANAYEIRRKFLRDVASIEKAYLRIKEELERSLVVD